MASEISPQGYKYEIDPVSEHPFWGADEIQNFTITTGATVDDTTGTPSVKVTTEQGKSTYDMQFTFSGLKGETGAQGPQGETGETGETGPQGEQGPQGETGTAGVSPVVVSTGSTESGTSAGTITGADGSVITVYNGQKGETGETGPQGPQGETGTATVPDDVLIEVSDSITEDTDHGYDIHNLKDTNHGGTQQDVSSFYIGRKQVISATGDGSGNLILGYVDQSGQQTSETLGIGGGGGTLDSMFSVAHTITSMSEFSSFIDTYSDKLVLCKDEQYLILGAMVSVQRTLFDITASGLTRSLTYPDRSISIKLYPGVYKFVKNQSIYIMGELTGYYGTYPVLVYISIGDNSIFIGSDNGIIDIGGNDTELYINKLLVTGASTTEVSGFTLYTES